MRTGCEEGSFERSASDATARDVVAGAAGVFYSRPVFDGSGNVIGAVVMRIKAEPIAKILAGAQVGLDRAPFLVDGDGVVVWHPDESLMFRSLAPLSNAKLEEVQRQLGVSVADAPEAGGKSGASVSTSPATAHPDEEGRS